jgi:hypothetical protein
MYQTDHEDLANYRPSNVTEDQFKKDLEAIMDNSGYHSDEASETDEEKTAIEISEDIRPKNKEDTDYHVIRVYDKPWRSRRVSK